MTDSGGPPVADVRGRGFGPRAEFAAVLALLDARTATLPGESVVPTEADGRVLAAAVTSTVNVPGFPRAAMDGYAVRGSDTAGATDAHPRALKLIGEAFP